MGAGPQIPAIDLGSGLDQLLNDATGGVAGSDSGGNVPIPPYLSTTPPNSGTAIHGNSSSSAQADPTIIINESSGSNILPYVLIGLGAIAIIGLIVIGGRRSHGGGGSHKHHK